MSKQRLLNQIDERVDHLTDEDINAVDPHLFDRLLLLEKSLAKLHAPVERLGDTGPLFIRSVTSFIALGTLAGSAVLSLIPRAASTCARCIGY